MRTVCAFPDTNVLLQCRALEQLPWGDEIEADEIQLLIGAPVQDEIDKLKNDGNGRRATRARSVNAVFRRLLASPTHSLTIREYRPRVELKFAPPVPTDQEMPPTLDRARADDRLIAEVIYFRRNGADACVVTDDIGMQLRCPRHEVPCVAVPESWKLPPENDERDKTINALKTQIAQLLNAQPVLDLSVQDQKGQPLERVSQEVPIYPPLSEGEIDSLMNTLNEQHPPITDFSAPTYASGMKDGMPAFWTLVESLAKQYPPSPEQIEHYERDYKAWTERARESFKELGAQLNIASSLYPLRVTLTNTGSQPADELLIEIIAHDGVLLCVGLSEEIPDLITRARQLKGKMQLPLPPRAPRGEMLIERAVRNSQLLEQRHRPFDLSSLPKSGGAHHDRHSFYRRERKPDPSNQLSFYCQEFRHQREAVSWTVWLLFPPHTDELRTRLHLRVSARNLANPISHYIPIQVRSLARSTYEVAERWRLEP
jgi:hypothetical protein